MEDISLNIRKLDNIIEFSLPRNLGHFNSIDIGQEIVLTIRGEPDGCNILMNCKDLMQINNSGLRVFIITLRKLEQSGRRLNLCSVNPPVFKFFEEAGIIEEFELFESEAEALKALGG